MRDTRGEMQDVELVDDTTGAEQDTGQSEPVHHPGASDRCDPTASVPDERNGPVRAVRRALRGRNRWWWGVGGALILALAVPSVVHSRHEQARLEHLAEQPGILAPLSGPVAELWHTDSSFVWIPQSVSRIGDMLVGMGWVVDSSRTTTTTEVRGIDARTGLLAWSHPVTEAQVWVEPCVSTSGPTEGPGRAVTVCQVVDETAPDQVVEGAAAVDGGTAPVPAYATVVHWEVIDPRTGAALTSYPAGVADRVVAFGSDIVLSTVDSSQGEIVVSRMDPRTGTTLWTAAHDARDARSGGVAAAGLSTTGERILVQSGQHAWVLTGAGATVDEWTLGDAATILPTSGGRLLEVTSDGSNGSLGIRRLGAQVPVVPTGTTLPDSFDDGSAPDVLLTNGGTLVAWDLGTGKQRWTSRGSVIAAALVDGCVYSVGAGVVRAQDARTGAERWTVDPKLSHQSYLATDGRVLVVAGRTEDADRSVVRGYDLEDGRQLWESPLTRASQTITVVGGMLFSQNADGSSTALG